jgi:hypothetical protein
VLTVQEARNANLGIPDEDVLAFAVISFPVASELYSFLQPEERYRSYHTDATGFDITNKRAVLTLNRIDFIRLHASKPNHAGIIVCKDDQQDRQRMATRISDAISNVETLGGMLLRVNRPSQ